MNEAIFYYLYSFAHRSVFLDNLAIFLATVFPYTVIILAGIFLLFHKEEIKIDNFFKIIGQKYREIVLALFSGISAWILAHALKFVFQFDRPFETFSEVTSIFPKEGYSFPSGHAAFFTALSLSIFFYHKKAGYVFMFFALLISLARIVAGVHFPVDILGGIVLGALVAFLVKYVRRKLS